MGVTFKKRVIALVCRLVYRLDAIIEMDNTTIHPKHAFSVNIIVFDLYIFMVNFHYRLFRTRVRTRVRWLGLLVLYEQPIL